MCVVFKCARPQRLVRHKAIVHYWPGLTYLRGRTEIPSRKSEGAPTTSSVIPLVRGLNLNRNCCSDFLTAQQVKTGGGGGGSGRGDLRPATPSFTHSEPQLAGRGRPLGVRPPGTPVLPFRGAEAGQGRQTPHSKGAGREIRPTPGPAGTDLVELGGP